MPVSSQLIRAVDREGQGGCCRLIFGVLSSYYSLGLNYNSLPTNALGRSLDAHSAAWLRCRLLRAVSIHAWRPEPQARRSCGF